jgi:poly(A) polymerase
MAFAWLTASEVQRLVAAFPPGSLRFVGGAVRDSILGKPVGDIDAATTLTPDATMGALEKAGIKAIPTGIAHGTITAAINGKSLEITTLRKDVATDGRHATVAYTDDWQEDAKRRDFTMNALYLSPEGTLIDYFAGVADAKAGRITFIGDPAARIQEDYLRILRFFRFYAYYGKIKPESSQLAACAAHAAGIATLSGERIQQEMLKLLFAPRASDTLSLMPPEVIRATFGFTLHKIQAVANLEKIEQQLQVKPQALIRLSLLLPSPSALEHLAQKWKLPQEARKKLQIWQLQGEKLSEKSDVREQKKLIRALGQELFSGLVMQRWAEQPAAHWSAMIDLANHWQVPVFPVSGNDLIALGIAPGKAMGELLAALEATWEAADYALSKEALLASAKP